MSTTSVIYKNIIGKKKCTCSNSRMDRYFKFVGNTIANDKKKICEHAEKSLTLEFDITALESDIKSYEKLINSKAREMSSSNKHKQYNKEKILVINDYKKIINNIKKKMYDIANDRVDIYLAQTSLRKIINEKKHELTLLKIQYDKTKCICKWNSYTYDNCSVCMNDSKLFKISCDNNHFFCRNCIKQLVTTNSPCPYCRTGSCNIASFNVL